MDVEFLYQSLSEQSDWSEVLKSVFSLCKYQIREGEKYSQTTK